VAIFSWRRKRKKYASEEDGAEMGFFDHLEELRWHLFRSVVVISVFAVVLFVYRTEVIGTVFMSPLRYDFVTYRFICEHMSDDFCPPDADAMTLLNEKKDSIAWTMGMDLPATLALPTDSSRPQQAIDVKVHVSVEDFVKAGKAAGFEIKKGTKEFVSIQAISPYEQFVKAMLYAFLGGLIFAFPYVVYEFWRFIRPALSPKEVKKARWNVVTISALFFTGVIFSYYILLPLSIQFLSSFVLFEEASNIWRIGDVINFEMLLLFGTGLMFQLPVVVYYLSLLGFITPQFLKKYRRHSIVVLLIVAGVVTPPDPFSQILVFFPLMALYEVGIVISRRVNKRKEREEKAEQAQRDARRAAADKADAENSATDHTKQDNGPSN
jgi:sec-independent protein translocase protein TatC